MKKTLSIILSLVILSNLLFGPFVYAQEGSPTPEPTAESTAESTTQSTPESSSDPSLSLSPSPSLSSSPMPSSTPDSTQTLKSEAQVEGDSSAEAATGENFSQGGQEAEIKTGPATAIAQLINFVNNNIKNSKIRIEILNFIENLEETDINLQEIWQRLIDAQKEGEEDLSDQQTQDANLDKDAQLDSSVTASAQSGQNKVEADESVKIDSGDAIALANLINAVNLEAEGSSLYFGLINIAGNFEGDIIVPRQEKVTPETNPSQTGQEMSTTSANLEAENEVESSASTGQNQSFSNSASTQTGQAHSIANSFTFGNLRFVNMGWYWLMLNTTGKRSGKVVNASFPGSVEEESGDGQVLHFQAVGQEEGELQEGADTEPSKIVEKQLSIQNKVQAEAESGGNEAQAESTTIKTGKALSAANLFNLLNLEIFNSRLFFSTINILGDWSGDLIYAYPDLSVSLSGAEGELQKGDFITYEAAYQNQGYDKAGGGLLQVELPSGFEFIDQNSNLNFSFNKNVLTWELGEVKPGASGEVEVVVKVKPDIDLEDKPSLVDLLIPVARAQEQKQKAFEIKAAVFTKDPDSNLSNNTAVKQSLVVENETEQGEMKLELSVESSHNVANFVYPADTVTFAVKIKNKSPFVAYDAFLVHELFDESGNSLGAYQVNIGQLDPGQVGTLNFGMDLDPDLIAAGEYKTASTLVAFNENNREYRSNTAGTSFLVQGSDYFGEEKIENTLPSIDAQIKETEPQVLGVQTAASDESVLPWVILMLLSGVYLSRWFRARYLYLDEKN